MKVQMKVFDFYTVKFSYLEDAWPLARRGFIPAIEILVRCLSTNLIELTNNVEKTRRCLQATSEGLVPGRQENYGAQFVWVYCL